MSKCWIIPEEELERTSLSETKVLAVWHHEPKPQPKNHWNPAWTIDEHMIHYMRLDSDVRQLKRWVITQKIFYERELELQEQLKNGPKHVTPTRPPPIKEKRRPVKRMTSQVPSLQALQWD